MNFLDKYLSELAKKMKESIFAVDSVHTGKSVKPKILGPIYPNSEDDEDEEEKLHNESIEMDLKQVLLIDFDNTIHNYYDGWRDGTVYGEPLEGAIESVQWLNKHFKIVIFTTRVSPATKENVEEQKRIVTEWLNKYKIPFEYITSDKVPCFRMIDDLALTFTNWKDMIDKIKKII